MCGRLPDEVVMSMWCELSEVYGGGGGSGGCRVSWVRQISSSLPLCERVHIL